VAERYLATLAGTGGTLSGSDVTTSGPFERGGDCRSASGRMTAMEELRCPACQPAVTRRGSGHCGAFLSDRHSSLFHTLQKSRMAKRQFSVRSSVNRNVRFCVHLYLRITFFTVRGLSRATHIRLHAVPPWSETSAFN
jgi:hypothetical protein